MEPTAPTTAPAANSVSKFWEVAETIGGIACVLGFLVFVGGMIYSTVVGGWWCAQETFLAFAVTGVFLASVRRIILRIPSAIRERTDRGPLVESILLRLIFVGLLPFLVHDEILHRYEMRVAEHHGYTNHLMLLCCFKQNGLSLEENKQMLGRLKREYRAMNAPHIRILLDHKVRTIIVSDLELIDRIQAAQSYEELRADPLIRNRLEQLELRPFGDDYSWVIGREYVASYLTIKKRGFLIRYFSDDLLLDKRIVEWQRLQTE